ncbi:MAG: SCO family protein [Phycisphaerales bacterium]|nr:SCO family protein [Phycisphaerales bacterium]
MATCALVAHPAQAQRVLESIPETDGVGLTTKVGDMLPLDTPFKDTSNNDVMLGSMFDGERPVLLLFVYFTCPLQCPYTMQQTQIALNELYDKFGWTAGEQYRLLVVSFDHNDTPRSANQQREGLVAGLHFEPRKGGVEIWTSTPEQVRKVADAAGFYYRYIPEARQFSHVSALIYLRPDGTIHNYMKGFPFPAKQVRLGLLEASEGKQGTVFEQVLQFCYTWSDSEGQYTLQAKRVMQLTGGVTVLVVGAFVGGLFLSGHLRGKNGRRMASNAGDTTSTKVGAAT